MIVVGFVLYLLLLPETQAARQPIVVSAAISLTDALQEIEKAYTAAGGSPVRFNFAASNVLARQIANGAPVDLFISADEAQMDFAARGGAIDTTTRRHLLSNRLAIVTPGGQPITIADARGLLSARVRRIAIGDPAAVPAGAYAKAFLERAGVWEALRPKLVPLASVRAALGAAESGSADAAIVYESDAASSRKVQLAYVFPASAGPSITYPAAITSRGTNRAAAERFMAFLRGPHAREIFRRFKFSTSTPYE
ncbi:MAG TPA: molybdate ABC transporter substrate-binding protein [Vicinamibacterales bacterium]|nr:molybdate ABC transporter substrate-binding protein [Vicinamibacterales bacterium]